MTINEIIFMQLRIVRLFSERFFLKVSEVNHIFCEHGIYELIQEGYGTYHCGGDEIVYEDVLEILKREGALA